MTNHHRAGDLDTILAAALDEFASDPTALRRLTATAQSHPDRLAHVLGHLRYERDHRETYQAVAAQITAAGVPLVDDDTLCLPEGARWLVHLPAPEGDGMMTEMAHRSCPGHAGVVVEGEKGYEAAYLCLAAARYGHITVPALDSAGEDPAIRTTDER